MDLDSRQAQPHSQSQRPPRVRDERRSFSESLADGTSKFFSSVIAKKNGLISDISRQIETTFTPSSSSSREMSLERGRSQEETPPPTPPPRPPPPRKPPNVHALREKERLIKRMASLPAYTRTDSATASDGPRAVDRQLSMNGMNISFDEPIYTRKSVGTSGIETGAGESSQKEGCSSGRRVSGEEEVEVAERKMQDGNDSGAMKIGARDEETGNDAEMGGGGGGGGGAGGGGGSRKAPKFTTIKRRSSTIDEMLFDDYVEPDNNSDAVFSPENLPPDLMSFDQDVDNQRSSTGAADIAKASPNPSQSSVDSNGEGGEGGTHHGLYVSTSLESSDAEYGGVSPTVNRSSSMGSMKSWSSNYSIDSQPDDVTLECMEFMKMFVDKIFSVEEETSQVEKAKFGELCQHAPGRLWFARYVNSQRVNNKRVPEQIFFRLVQYLAVCLFECNEAEDFSPAKTLMNMCFTFYCDMPGPGGDKSFLYMFLKDQPIWQSLRFWNAAFFDAVQCERSRRPMPTNSAANDTMTDDRNFQENITFGQLGTFACNMRAFGLSRELCMEFLRKQSTIANLSEDQVKLLRDNVDKMKDT